MTDLPQILVERNSGIARFNGSWYRGPHTNFIPNRQDLQQPNAIREFITYGWEPDAPFITRDSKITAFGSCFAVHVSQFLHERGYTVMGKNLNMQAHIVRFGEGIVNTFAVLQQLEWALTDKPMQENLWFGADKEIAATDPKIREQTRQIISETDVFIITLGLSEIWYDKVTNEAFWRAIPAQYFDETRHGFRQSTVQENYENLRRIVLLIAQARPQARIVFTLSPVPLLATFRPISCLTANAVSKGTIRVALDQLFQEMQKDAGVYYFPSYEIVKEYFIDPYATDNRHVKPEVVATVMEAFSQIYCH